MYVCHVYVMCSLCVCYDVYVMMCRASISVSTKNDWDEYKEYLKEEGKLQCIVTGIVLKFIMRMMRRVVMVWLS